MIGVAACARVLEPLRFELAWQERYSKFEHTFRRKGPGRTFEFVEISGSRKRGEIVDASVHVSLLRNALYVGRELPALDAYLDPPGKLELDTGDKKTWLTQLAHRAEELFAAAHATEVQPILDQTSKHDARAQRYVDRIRAHVGDDDFETIATQMEMRATAEQRARADRMCSNVGGAPSLARTTVLLGFQRFGVEIEGRDPTEGKRYLRDDFDDWLTGELVADRLIG